MGPTAERTMQEFKVLICGDGAIGKTCLLDTITERSMVNWDDPDYVPTAAENLECKWDVDGIGESRIELWDTAGQEALETLRLTAYPGTQVLLLGFDLTNKTTLENIEENWIKEFDSGCQDCNVKILVGTKYDWLKEKRDELDDPCDETDGSILKVAQAVGACAVVLTSAKTGEGINNPNDAGNEPSFFNQDPDSDGVFLIDVITDYCSAIYKNEKPPVVQEFVAAPAPPPAPEPEPEPPAPAPVAEAPVAEAPAPAAPAPAPAPTPSPAPAAQKKPDDSCCTVL